MDREKFSDYAEGVGHSSALAYSEIFTVPGQPKLIDTSEPTDWFPGGQGDRQIPVSEARQQNSLEVPDYTKLTSTGDGRPSKIGPFELTPGQIKDWGRVTTKDDLRSMVAGGKLQESTADMLLEGKHHQVVLEMLQYGQKITPDLLQRFVPQDLQQAVKAFVDKK